MTAKLKLNFPYHGMEIMIEVETADTDFKIGYTMIRDLLAKACTYVDRMWMKKETKEWGKFNFDHKAEQDE